MNNRKDHNSIPDLKALRKELQGVDELFAMLEKDKDLPSFGEFFVTCIVMGNAECVDLKKLYPRQFDGIAAWLKSTA